LLEKERGKRNPAYHPTAARFKKGAKREKAETSLLERPATGNAIIRGTGVPEERTLGYKEKKGKPTIRVADHMSGEIDSAW